MAKPIATIPPFTSQAAVDFQFLVLFILVAIIHCVSCNKEKQGPDNPEHSLEIQFENIELDHFSGSFDLDVTANCEWSFAVDASWAYVVEPRPSYSGSKQLTINVLRNDTISERTAVFSFNYQGGSRSLVVKQAGFDVFLDVSDKSLSFGHLSAQRVISVTSNCGWDAKTDAIWLDIRPITGLVGNFDMTVEVSPNDDVQPRSAIITIWNQNYSLVRTVSVTQDGRPNIGDKDYIDEYGVNQGAGIYAGGSTWAPVNVGFHPTDFPFGKLYQWGRKFGLAYSDESYKDAAQLLVSSMWEGANGQESPVTFYTYGENSIFSYDWIKAGDDRFWNMGSEEKPVKNTDFDPCPDGWRIPTSFELKSLLNSGAQEWVLVDGVSGYRFGDVLFFPAAGRLNAVDGTPLDRNLEGYYWSMFVNEGSSAYMYICESGHSVNMHGSRSGACSLRCVRE